MSTIKPIPIHHQRQLDAIGNYLRELRFSEGLTIKELSEHSDLHRNTIQRAETGHVTLKIIFTLAEVFELTPYDIISIIE